MSIDYPSAAQLPALRMLWMDGFGDDDVFLDRFFSTGYCPRRCRCITVQGQLAAALYWFDCQWEGKKAAYLYAVATVPAYRGQGLCRSLMEDTHLLLEQKGYAGTILVPGEPGLFRMYEKMGYSVMSGVDSITCSAAQPPVALRQVSAEEYALSRRRLLPVGGVLQEDENLTFLASWAKLYIGKDFVLAAVIDGSHLQGLELLGDASAAPGILTALGLESGTFRTPGKKPYAMFRPLGSGIAPTYFGLAFD